MRSTAKCPRGMTPVIKRKGGKRRKEIKSNPGGSGKIGRCRNHERSPLSQLAIQPSQVKKAMGVANVCGFSKNLNKACPQDGGDVFGLQSKPMAESNANKADAVLSLPAPGCIRRKKLNGKLASLNRILSKSAEKSLPFFKTLKKCTKKSDFQWT
ncbi:hypothetical protein Tco_0524473 [Tanacetum coccineum]